MKRILYKTGLGLLDSDNKRHPINIEQDIQSLLSVKKTDSFCNKWNEPVSIKRAILPEISASISIYPNPANDVVTISSGEPRSFILQLTDLPGRTLVLRHAPATGKLTVPSQQLPNGIYLVKILLGNKNYTQKLMIFH